MKKLLWAPGYIIIAIVYFFPTEWGKKRNVALGSRWWNYKDYLAPIFSICFYIFIAIKMVLPSAEVKPPREPIQSERLEIKPGGSSTEQMPSNIGGALSGQTQNTGLEIAGEIQASDSPSASNAADREVNSESDKPEQRHPNGLDEKTGDQPEQPVQHIPGHY